MQSFLGIFLSVALVSTNGTVADPVKLINIYEILCPTCDPHQCTPVDCYNWLMTDKCRESFEKILDKYDNRERCTWDKIKSSYTNFTECTELYAEILMIPWPNQLVEDTFVQIHASYFQDCRVTELFDPPPSVIFVLVMTPICLIPVMVTLVVLKTKNGDGTS